MRRIGTLLISILLISLLFINILSIPSESRLFTMDSSIGLSSASFVTGGTFNYAGRSLSIDGDYNGDGFDDILIGVPGSWIGGSDKGQTFLIFGRPSNWSMDTYLPLYSNASFLGEEPGDKSGTVVTSAGDINGDGFDDFLIGSPNNDQFGENSGKVHIVFGKSSGWSMLTLLKNSQFSFRGITGSTSDNSGIGSSIAPVGDVNGDGFSDFMIGDPNADIEGYHEGKVYLIFGKSSGWGKNVDISTITTSFVGEENSDFAGWKIAGIGDVNGDGYDDLMIGAIGNDEFGKKTGQVYIIFGKRYGWEKDMPLSQANASFHGEMVCNSIGCSLAGVGDVNGDGLDDIAIGNYNNQPTDMVYLVFGRRSGWEMGMNISTCNASFKAEYPNDHTGFSMAGPGDLNNDGFDDILIGAPQNNEKDTWAGQAYLIHGMSTGWGKNINISKSNYSFQGENDRDKCGYCVAGNGDVNGDGNMDIIISSPENDEKAVKSGQIYLFLDLFNDPPKILTPNIGEAEVYLPYSVKYVAKDNESKIENMEWLLNTNATWIEFKSSNGELKGTPLKNNVGSYWVNITVFDEHGGSDWTNFTLVVDDNNPPVIETKDVRWATEESKYLVKYYAIDPETRNIDLNWTMKTDAKWLKFDKKNNIISGIPLNSDVGVYWVNMSVWDEYGGISWSNFSLTVNNTNDPPILSMISDQHAYEDTLYQLELNATDEDPTYDILEWELFTDANFLKIDPFSHEIMGIPTQEDIGSYFVNIRVSDGNGGSDWSNFTLIVEDVNDPPIIITDNVFVAIEEENYWVHYNASDIDTEIEELEWSFNSNSEFLSFNPESRVLTGIPDDKDIGDYWVNISLNDGEGGLVWTNFTLKVEPINDPPIIFQDSPHYELIEDSYLLLFLYDLFKDNDSQNLSFRVLPSDHLKVFFKGNVSEIIPYENWNGEENIQIIANDSQSEVSINIKLKIKPVNDHPTDVRIDCESIYFFNSTQNAFGNATDPDLIYGDDLNFKWTSNITGDIGYGMVINLSLTPGFHRVTLTVYDSGGLTNSTSVEVRIFSREMEPFVPDKKEKRDIKPTLILSILGILIISTILITLGIIFIFKRSVNKEVIHIEKGPNEGER